MANKALHGNGVNCPACALRRDQLRALGALNQEVPCNFCGSLGRVKKTDEEIIRETCELAAANYWPKRYAAWDRDNADRMGLR